MFILAGEGNVEGYASSGHLQQLVTAVSSDGSPVPYQHLWNASAKTWAVRDDVFVAFEHHRNEDWTHGPLTVGSFGGDSNTFGPELQLGHLLGDAYEEPVVIVKTGWKGRSLATDFASPSTNNTGFQWFRMIKSIHRAANSLHEILGPEYKYSRPDFRGFVWWQGYTDYADTKMSTKYGDNLERFLNDIRTELKQPFMPLVVGELGGQGLVTTDQRELDFRKTQEQVVSQRFMNWTARFVPTATYVKTEPAIKDYTLYYGNAPTMLEISQAFAMSLLSMDYTKLEGDGDYGWVASEADVMTQSMENRNQFHEMMMIGLVGTGLFVFVAIMRYGGNMGQTWNTAFSPLRPSSDTEDEADDKGLELDATARAVNMEEDLPERSIPDIRKSGGRG